MQAETMLHRNPDVIAVDMDGETMMMHIETGNYHSLNAVGSHVWTLLETPCNAGQVIASVSEAFEISDADQVDTDILGFLDQLLESDLIRTEG